MTFSIFLFILVIHWVADFCIQTDQQAKGKSTSIKLLTYHIITYSLVWLFGGYLLFSDSQTLGEMWAKCGIFAGVTFVAHWITDYFTSRIGKPFWEKGNHHDGFVVVGFDQILHYVQLYLTYIWVKDLTI